MGYTCKNTPLKIENVSYPDTFIYQIIKKLIAEILAGMQNDCLVLITRVGNCTLVLEVTSDLPGGCFSASS